MKFIMLMQLKHNLRWTAPALCSLVLVALLAACGTTTTSTTSTTPTTSTSASTPTKAAPSSTTSPVTQQVIAGNGFTMSYPQGWQLSRSGARLITLTDSTGNMKMTITIVPSPNGAISADSLLNTAVKAEMATLKDTQKVSVPPTVTVGGDSWSQQSISGTLRLNAANIVAQSVVLAVVHPAKTVASKGYTIAYRAPQSTFAQVNTTYFQPMLQSFKFQ